MRIRRSWLWIGFAGVNAAAAGYFVQRWQGPDRTVFLPGPTTHGHYQIELDCQACHTPWMGVQEAACYKCHEAELKLADDSHPKSKFTDPRNADRLQLIDAANCVTCHREHVPQRTGTMGVTMPSDYCFHCHQQTLKDRPSHRDLPFNSCATAGCHNYHDNTALYESFLLKHLDEPDVRPEPRVARRTVAAFTNAPLTATGQDAPATAASDPAILQEWVSTAHAVAGVNCTGCHAPAGKGGTPATWTDHPTHEACASCHKGESEGFLAGRHGMRLAQGLSPMQPALARLPMKADAAHRDLACTSCHGDHDFNTRRAAVEACMSCHNDPHTLAYTRSPHYTLWQEELSGSAPAGSGVSCATCHLPAETVTVDGSQRVVTQHNQNAHLRPNEKMVRTVCLDCHGLSFALDALADADLIQANFRGSPSRHVESLGMAAARRRMLETTKKTTSRNTP